ncbi:MAG: GspH/FimT family pseudopilin [Burkholderiales bacterium]
MQLIAALSPRATGCARRVRGFTLIELAVAITLLGILIGLGLPSFMSWIRNSQVRSVAESLQNGIRRAQTEAVRLNQTVVFSLTNVAPGLNAPAVANGSNWSIQSIQQFADPTRPPVFLTGGSLTDVASSMSITGPVALCFNTNGRLIVPAVPTGVPGAVCTAGKQQFDIKRAATIDTTTDRQLRVLVAVGGQVHMCDLGRPTLSDASPDGCPP